jgi:hypothetical protein
MSAMVGSDQMTFDYQERVVALIDVLGFTNLVKRSSEKPAELPKICRLIAANKLFERVSSEFLPFADAAFFSDSFVLSMRWPEHHLIYLIREIGYLCRYLLLQGFPCRGAIATGLLFHEGRFIVGPALVDAYRLEKSVAIYPRVILDDATMAYWRNEFRLDEFGQGSAHQHLETLVKRDCDGWSCIDIFNPEWSGNFIPWSDVVPSAEVIPPVHADFIEQARKRIGEGHATSSDPKILAKYDWLANACELWA